MRVSMKKSFLFFYGLFIIDCVLSESHIVDNMISDFFLTVVRYSSLACLTFVGMYKGKFKTNRKLWLGCFLILCALINAVFYGGGTSLLCIAVVLMAYKECHANSKELFSFTMKMIAGASISVFLLSLLGLIKDTVGTRVVGLEMGAFFARTYVRHSYGFIAANLFPLNLVIMYILRISYKGNDVTFSENIAWLVTDFVFFNVFGSRISFIILFVDIVACLLLQLSHKVKSRKKLLKNHFPKWWMCFPVCFAISAFASFKYDVNSSQWRYINNVFMDRFRMAHFAIRQYGVSAFGKGMEASQYINGIENAVIDNGYISVLLQNGIFICLIVIVAWSFLTYNAERQKREYLLVGLVSLAVMNVIDAHLISYKMLPFYCLMLDKTISKTWSTKQ